MYTGDKSPLHISPKVGVTKIQKSVAIHKIKRPMCISFCVKSSGWNQLDFYDRTGLPLGGRSPYIMSKNGLCTPKLHIKDVPQTSENSLVRPKMVIETFCLQKKNRPHLPDYVIYVPPSYWKLISFVY